MVKLRLATEEQRKAARLQGTHYFEYFFRCPNRQCKAIYMTEEARRYPGREGEGQPVRLDRPDDLEACRAVLDKVK